MTEDEMKELYLRLKPGRPALQELSARYLQVRSVEAAAEIASTDPSKSTPEWKAAAEEFGQASTLYLQASDSLAALALCNLWPLYGESVGSHILALCDQWVATPSSRPSISKSIERIHFAMMQMGQIAVDPDRPKPTDLSSTAKTALESSGWSMKAKAVAVMKAKAAPEKTADKKTEKSAPARMRASAKSAPSKRFSKSGSALIEHPAKSKPDASVPASKSASTQSTRSAKSKSDALAQSAKSASPPTRSAKPASASRISTPTSIQPISDFPASTRTRKKTRR